MYMLLMSTVLTAARFYWNEFNHKKQKSFDIVIYDMSISFKESLIYTFARFKEVILHTRTDRML
jgi:hypothetical protein